MGRVAEEGSVGGDGDGEGGEMSDTIERVGVAQSKKEKLAVMFQRVRVRLSTKFRVFPVPGDSRSFDLDPTEWSERYRVVKEYKTNASGRPT